MKIKPGGLPSKRMFKKEHRNIHPSYYGNIGANATTEYADVGVVNHHTLTPLLSNRYGSYGSKDISKANGWEMLSLDESLIPFVNEIQADRAIIAYTHRAQVAPIIHGELPLVATGAEYLVPQIASARFIQRAQNSGTVQEVSPEKCIKVKYDNNRIEYVDITPRLATTKRASYIRLPMETLQVGDKFKKNEAIAWTHSFDKNGYYATGRNLKMALMNYIGYSHEDGYVISNDVSDKFITESVEEINVIVPIDHKVLNMITKKQNTEPGESLIEFTYAGNLDDYLDEFNLMDETSEESESGIYNYIGNKIQVKSPGGEICEIRIYLNNRQSVDPTLIQIWKEVTSDLKERQKLYSIGKTSPEEKISAIDNLDMSQLKTGTHKFRGFEFEGARVVFYLKKTKQLGHGDKVCNRYGGKGIVTKVLNDNEHCTAEYTGNIDIFLSPISVLGRKNLAVVKELYIGKILYFLPQIMSKRAGGGKYNTSTLKQQILTVYDILDNSKDKKYFNLAKQRINNIPDNKFRKMLYEKTLYINLIIEPFVNISMESIKSAADFLDIPLEENIYIPATGMWTKKKVPVGIQYMHAMEQLAEDYESLRSTGGYRSITGQPQKGRANMGGQSMGNWDIYSMLSYNMKSTLQELLTVRSDDFRSKRKVVMDIIENGEASMPEDTGDASTKDLYRTHLIGMGLDPD